MGTARNSSASISLYPGCIDKCTKGLRKHKKTLLKAAILPLTSCSAERCFGATKILKTRLRSTMNDERLSGLAMMYINKDTDISMESMINNFSLANRKLGFCVMTFFVSQIRLLDSSNYNGHVNIRRAYYLAGTPVNLSTSDCKFSIFFSWELLAVAKSTFLQIEF